VSDTLFFPCTDKIDVTRDILAYMVVLGVIIGVAYDGKVPLIKQAVGLVPRGCWY